MSKYSSLEDEINDFAKKKMIVVPGAEFRYGNIGLNTAGRVLEIIANKPFEQLMNERIFISLGMNNSSFVSDKAVNPSGGAKKHGRRLYAFSCNDFK